jgi:hypothetical protein
MTAMFCKQSIPMRYRSTAADLDKQRAVLNPPVASPVLLRDNNGQSLVTGG